MDNDTLKSRGTYFLGLGVLLLGIAGIVWSCTKIAETIYFRKFMASGTWPSSHSIMGERPREVPEPGIIVSNDTISFPMPVTEEYKSFNLEPKEKK